MNYNRTISEAFEACPIDALLAGLAAKTLPPALAALAAAHLELKPDNRAYVAALEAVQGVLLEQLRPVPLAGRDRRLVNIFAAPESAALPVPKGAQGDSDAVLPDALRRIAGCDLAALEWRHRGAGLKEAVLPDDTAAARFVRGQPGARLPIACEAGAVTAVVLAGAAIAGAARYQRGDVIFTGPEMPEAPTVVGEEECVCFVVTEAPAKPAWPFSRMLHVVTGG